MSEPSSRRSKIGLPLLFALLLILASLGYFVLQTYGGWAESDQAQIGSDSRAWHPQRGDGDRRDPRGGPTERGANAEEDGVRSRRGGGRGADGNPGIIGEAPVPGERATILPRAAPVINDAHDAVFDPQRVAMRRGLRITNADAGTSLPFEPVERTARITSLTGTVPFGSDDSCTVRVLPARNGRFNCLVRVVCGGRIVYPNQAQTAGFVRCELDARGQPLRGEDTGHTALDGDPLIRFDLTTRQVVIEDRGNNVEAFSVTVQLP